jgi:hypothetical protein
MIPYYTFWLHACVHELRRIITKIIICLIPIHLKTHKNIYVNPAEIEWKNLLSAAAFASPPPRPLPSFLPSTYLSGCAPDLINWTAKNWIASAVVDVEFRVVAAISQIVAAANRHHKIALRSSYIISRPVRGFGRLSKRQKTRNNLFPTHP